ncbi:MAG: polyprenyl synthetase family protein [Lachnospiraceae bacterium]|nr:polyprenyl synthetase family protein [Lachnospiraceae bacterium]
MDISKKAEQINEILTKFLPQPPFAEGSIEDAMNYSVMSGGKRLRGIMLLESFRLYNSDKDLEKDLAWPYAASMEFIHAYSLVHDDLPSMDNDMYRRGKLTTHAKYGHAMGVLTGDALLNYAFETMTHAASKLAGVRGEIAAELALRACRAMSVIADKAGYSGMIGGQVMDVCGDSENKDSSLDRIYRIYELKTSRLFQAAMCAGALLAGADDDQVKALDEAGYYIGEAFQIKDDILDTTATFEQLGKDIGSDEKNSKNTVASMLGIEKAQELVDSYLDKARDIFDRQPGNKEFFFDLIEFLRSRQA